MYMRAPGIPWPAHGRRWTVAGGDRRAASGRRRAAGGQANGKRCAAGSRNTQKYKFRTNPFWGVFTLFL